MLYSSAFRNTSPLPCSGNNILPSLVFDKKRLLYVRSELRAFHNPSLCVSLAHTIFPLVKIRQTLKFYRHFPWIAPLDLRDKFIFFFTLMSSLLLTCLPVMI